MRSHGMWISNQILHGDQTILEKKLQGQPRHLPWPKIFRDTNADMRENVCNWQNKINTGKAVTVQRVGKI